MHQPDRDSKHTASRAAFADGAGLPLIGQTLKESHRLETAQGYHGAVLEIERRRHSRALLGIVTSLAVSAGCLGTVEYPQISLSYRAQGPVERVPGAEAIKVNVVAKDMRPNKDWVCARSMPAIGIERQAVGRMESVTPPAGLVSRAIKAELSHRGFEMDYKGIPVVANVDTFVCYCAGRLSTIDAEVGVDLFVYRAGRPPIGQEFFYRHVKGEYSDQDPLRTWDKENAKIALEAALEDAMKQLFSDRRFINALLDPAVQAPPPSAKRPPPPPMPYTPN